MLSLFSYIFHKSYFLCVNVFKEKEFPEFFASGIIAVVIVGTIMVFVNVFLYQINPSLINMIFEYYKYFSLGSVLFFWWYFGYMKKYVVFMNHFERMSNTKKRAMKVVSILYLILLLVLFFGMSDIMRTYNLSE